MKVTKDLPTQPHIAVDDLRVGMFIHLEGGWLAHPFPLSNFKLSSPQQIATIRSLRLKSVRWSPEKSDLEHGTADMEAPLGSPAPAAEAAAAAMLASICEASESPELAAERERRLALAAQRESMNI